MSTPLVDVLLPLAVPGAYTYAVPASLEGRLGVGSHVVVPLGKNKRYSGIVVRCPGTPPAEGITLKEVEELVSDRPVLLPSQVDMWRWMAYYYMCTPGEVMKAALPAGLRLESETHLVAAPDYDADDLPPIARTILAHLRGDKGMCIKDLQKAMKGLRGMLGILNGLIRHGAVTVSEKVSMGYRPRTEQYVVPGPACATEAAAHAALDSLQRSPRQTALLLDLLSLPSGERIARSRLMKMHPGAESALAALVKKEMATIIDCEVSRLATDGTMAEPAPLSPAQQRAHDDIHSRWATHDVCLLHGVTSSGKTEIYTHLIHEVIAAGGQVLYLVPEIALTTQLTDRLARVFGPQMGVYHSRYPDALRAELWLRQLSDRPLPLVLGARSALFLPFRRLGLIIVDEEHETSYKQQEPAPCYHARDVAIMLARRAGAKVLLGTATPSIETYHNATDKGRYGLVTLTERYGRVQLPEVEVVDVKELRRKKLMPTPFSPRLITEVKQALADGQQAILFLNRRGYAPVLECRACGWVPHCTACDVPLTLHQSTGRLVCHYCGASYAVPTACPQCEGTDLRDMGCGTEKIEEAVQTCFPEARVARMDQDTTRSRRAYDRLISDFRDGQTNLLIGTQMVTKGLDFERVRIVGILDADQMLRQPDFRAFERAYQMMSQVAGRAGRRQTRGRVLLQTRQPDLEVVQQVVRSDYGALYLSQLAERREYLFPPFCRLIEIRLRHRDEPLCAHAAQQLAALLRPYFGDYLLGPDRPLVARVQNQHLRQMLLKVLPAWSPQQVRQTLLQAAATLHASPTYRAVTLLFNVDPQ